MARIPPPINYQPPAIICLHVIPKASKNQVVGWVTDAAGKQALKVKITTAPEDGKANKALLKFLAKEWDISPSAMEITAGGHSRHKQLKIHDETVRTKLPKQL